MKQYVKGLMTGLLAGAVIAAIPAAADSISALFNQVRINVGGVDRVQWGEEIEFSGGGSAPYSIMYNDTVYLPMRKLAELTDKKIYWNGDSKTVSLTGKPQNAKTIAEKPDADGNVWKYYTFEADGENYLGVTDKERGCDRVYRMSADSVRVTDNEVYFSKYVNQSYYPGYDLSISAVYRIPFNHNADNQDGEKISDEFSYLMDAQIDGDYYITNSYMPGNTGHSEFMIQNYMTGEKSPVFKASTWTLFHINSVESNEKEIKIYYSKSRATPGGSEEGLCVIYDKESGKFGEEIKTENYKANSPVSIG